MQSKIKTIEDQGVKQIIALGEHGIQLAKSNDENESLKTHSKQKEILKELANKRMEEIQDLSKQIWNMFKINNKDTKTKSLTSFVCLC